MTPKDYQQFGLYAKDKGISSLDLHYYNQKIKSSLTPYILEERQMNVTQMDIFSRLMHDRIIFLGGEVNDQMSMITQAELQFLDSLESTDITFQINTPGGSVSSGLAIIDVMEVINADIKTVNMQLCASMGSLLLGAGTKGKRCAFKNSKTMIHQSSGGFGGEFDAAEIQFREWTKTNNKIFEMLGEYTNKSAEQVKKDAVRDLWLDSNEALDYGLVDEIVKKKNSKSKK